jgi:uncharacterized membrane protein (DUF373 family)
MNVERNSPRASQVPKWADQWFVKVESATYFVLGVLLTLAVVKGMVEAGSGLFDSVRVRNDTAALVFAMDRLLLVLMIVEILHTVGVSFRSHSLTAEPFLVVGLIASIRRMLVITLESSQVGQAGRLATEGQPLLNGAYLELIVLGFLILVMVISIFLLRRSEGSPVDK